MEPIDAGTIDPEKTYTVRFGRTRDSESDFGGGTFEERELEMTGRQLLEFQTTTGGGSYGSYSPGVERVLINEDGEIIVREIIVPPDPT